MDGALAKPLLLTTSTATHTPKYVEIPQGNRRCPVRVVKRAATARGILAGSFVHHLKLVMGTILSLP
jgi:hypothetical protein